VDMKRVLVVSLSLIWIVLHVRCNNDSGSFINLEPPTITSISPNHVSRAERGTATIQGTNFSGATGVFLGNEVTIEGFTVINPNTIEVQFRVNSNATPGKRPVQVTTSVGIGNTPNLLEVLNNRAPIVHFTVFPESGAPNSVYTFDALRSNDPDGNIIRFDWEFGDGKKTTGPVVTHKFGTTGDYEVTLYVTDNDDARVFSTMEVKVKAGTAPTAKFSIHPQQGDVNTTYTLDASNTSDPDGRIVDYSWLIINTGATASGPVAQFHFKNSGPYSIVLIVTDNDGLQTSIRKDLIVGDFDQVKATTEIRAVVVEFFRRYSNLHRYTSQEIVVNWSQSPGCQGRAHEINIIDQQKNIIEQTTATVSGTIEVTFNSSTRAHAVAPADFNWVNYNDPTPHSSSAIHDFEFIFESGKWQICNFVLI
jgi:hypothetical protein